MRSLLLKKMAFDIKLETKRDAGSTLHVNTKSMYTFILDRLVNAIEKILIKFQVNILLEINVIYLGHSS